MPSKILDRDATQWLGLECHSMVRIGILFNDVDRNTSQRLERNDYNCNTNLNG
jgi:hypothetical protein